MRIYDYIHMWVNTRKCIHTNTHIHIYAHVCVHKRTHTHAYIRIGLYAQTHTYLCRLTCICTHKVRAYKESVFISSRLHVKAN